MEFQRTSGALLGFGINEVCEVLRVSGQAKQIGLQVKSRILQVYTVFIYYNMYMYTVYTL